MSLLCASVSICKSTRHLVLVAACGDSVQLIAISADSIGKVRASRARSKKYWCALQVMAEVDTSSRQGARKHHTATHLLQSALKQVLREEGEISQQVLLIPLSYTQGVDAYAGDCEA